MPTVLASERLEPGEIHARTADARSEDLENGLAPRLLTGGGLGSAFADLAAISPIPVAVHATSDRFGPTVEATL